MMNSYHKELIIRNFIFNKIQQGYSVRKITSDTYEFKIKTNKLKITEEIHSDTFLNDFVKIEQEYPVLYAQHFKEKS